MTWSLGEIEALGKKAARGAGYSWGVSEDAGRAIRWLCSMGWPGDKILARHLRTHEMIAWSDKVPIQDNSKWQARGRLICPLAAGSTLYDLASDLQEGPEVSMVDVANPALLAPFIAWASDAISVNLSLKWGGICLTRTEGESYLCADDMSLIEAPEAEQVSVSRGSDTADPHLKPLVPSTRAKVSPDAVKVLNSFAARTYAPETDESKLSGAGAGLSDND